MSSHTRIFDTIIHASLGLAAGLSAAFFAVLATRLGASPWLLALVASAPYLANLLAPFWVAQAKRWGTRGLMVGSLAAAGAVLFLLGLVRTPLVFALLVLLYYLFYGIGDPLYVALAEIVYPERTGSSLGRVQAVFNGMHALANALAGWLMDTLGVFITLAIAAISTGVAAVTYLPFPSLSNTVQEDKALPWQILRQDSLVRRMVLTLMVAGTGMVMMLPAFPLVEVQQLGLNNTQIGILLAVNSVALVAASWLWGWQLSETPAHIVNAFRLGMLAIVGMAVLYAMGGSFWELLVANILCGIGGSAISVGWRLFAIHYPYSTDDLSGLHLLTCGVRGLYGPALGALLIALWKPAVAFWIAAALVLVGMLILPPTERQLVLDGVLASTAIPPWVHPLELENRFLLDGGAISNLPIEPAILHRATEIIALDLSAPDEIDQNAHGFGPFWVKFLSTIIGRQTYLEMELAQAKGIPVYRVELIAEPPVAIWDFSQTPLLY